MGWSFRRSKSFGLFRLNFSKSGIGYSFGVPGARVGVNSKGKKYLRGGIPGTGIYYQSSLPDAQPGQSPQSTSSVSPLGILIALFVVGIINLCDVLLNNNKGSRCSPFAGRCSRRCPGRAEACCEETQAEACRSPGSSRDDKAGGGSNGSGASQSSMTSSSAYLWQCQSGSLKAPQKAMHALTLPVYTWLCTPSQVNRTAHALIAC
jgi:hypothetical protein